MDDLPYPYVEHKESKPGGLWKAEHPQMVRDEVNIEDVPQPPPLWVWVKIGIHEVPQHDVHNSVFDISLEVKSTVITCRKISPI